MIIRPKPPFGFSVFCDDVREEASGKVTLVGTYSGAMMVNGQTPLTIPMLCCHVTLYMDEVSATRGGTLQLCRVDKDDTREVLNSLELPKFELDELPKGRKIVPDADTLLTFSISMRLAPYLIGEEHLLRMIYVLGEDEYRIGALSIEIGAASE